MRLFFATDLHGSERCYRKFLNSAEFYDADVLVLGGDLTGKAILPITENKNGNYKADFQNKEWDLDASELSDFKRKIRDEGYYPYVANKVEIDEIRSDSKKSDELFVKVIEKSLLEWMELADERLGKINTPCYVIPGNDDIYSIDDIINESSWMINVARKKEVIEDQYEIIGLDYSNPTPWNSPRESPDQDLEEMIKELFKKVENEKMCILNFHPPPSNTPLDKAPKLTSDLKPVIAGGEMVTESVGSTAVRKAIEQHAPLLGLHGHVHESRGSTKLNGTLCLNPGSEYSDGILRGAVIDLNGGEITDYQFISG